MAESVVGIKITELPEAAQSQLTDASVAVVDDGVTTRKTKLSIFVAWLKSRMVKNNLDQTETGYALDAFQGKVLNDKITELNSALKTEITEINYQYYTSNTENTNIDMNFKIGNVVHLQCAFKRKDGGKYPISTGLIHIQNGSHRSTYNLTIPAYFRVGEQWYPHYVYVRTNGEIHQDFSNSAEEIIINGCYPVV